MALDKTTRVQHLFIDYPNIGEVIRPLSLKFAVDDTVTVEDVAVKNNLDVEAVVNDLKDFVEDEHVTNYVNHTKQDLTKTVHDRYIEDLKDELPVLHEYVKKVSKKKLKDENVHHAYDKVKQALNDYSELLEDTVHPLVVSDKHVEVYNVEVESKEKEIVKGFEKLRDVSNDYNSEPLDADVEFVYDRLERLEQVVIEMIALEQLIRRK